MTNTYWWLDHSWHHNDQYWSLIVEWISENPIFHWYLVPFLSEAAEASPCYFFQNWLMKLKCPNLLKPLDTIIQENCQPFYPSEPFRIIRFQMRHPVFENCFYISGENGDITLLGSLSSSISFDPSASDFKWFDPSGKLKKLKRKRKLQLWLK